MILINLIKFYLNYMGLNYELLQIETTNKIRLTNFSEDCKKSNQNTLRSLKTRHVVERSLLWIQFKHSINQTLQTLPIRRDFLHGLLVYLFATGRKISWVVSSICLTINKLRITARNGSTFFNHSKSLQHNGWYV